MEGYKCRCKRIISLHNAGELSGKALSVKKEKRTKKKKKKMGPSKINCPYNRHH